MLDAVDSACGTLILLDSRIVELLNFLMGSFSTSFKFLEMFLVKSNPAFISR